MTMKQKRAAPPCRLICTALALVLLLALAVPSLAGHQWSDRIRAFERVDPVYDEAVELGTAREALRLPATLRAIVDIPEELDADTFIQAAPEADTSDGSESYDYYWYGYVAPRDADALVAAGEKAIYTIYYADGQLAYRLYGSIAGSENLWFACDEAGAITGAVLDVPVEWSGDYDGETAGTYTFTASVSAESPYRWSGSAPSALVYVLSSDEDGGHREAEPVCTCGAEADEDGALLHGEDCPCYVPPQPVCTCGAEADEAADAPHREDCPLYVAEPLLCTCPQATNDRGDRHDEDCPCYVPTLTDCHCSPEGEAIDADNFPWAHQEDCRHFSPIECMCREQVAVELEDYDEDTYVCTTRTMLVPGDFSHVHDVSNLDCPLYGCDTVRFRKLATGEESVMAYDDASRIIAFQNRTAAPHAARQPARALTALNAGDGESLYPALGRIELISGSEQNAGDMLMSGSAFSLYAGGANEQAMDAIVKNQNILPTSGNTTFGSTPGAWLDYVRTRFRNLYDAWTWASSPSSHGNWKFSGKTVSQYNGTVDSNPLRIPYRVGKHWDVYSGEQLRYALAYFVNDDTIYLKGNLNLNGTNVNWGTLTIPNKKVTLDGGGHTIYNLGLLTTAYGRGALCAAPGGTLVTIKNLTFSDAKAVFHVAAQKPSSPGSAANGAGRTGLFVSNKRNARFEKVYIKNSLLAQTSPTKNAGGGLGAFGFITGGGGQTPVISKCSVEDTIIGGLGHPGAFTTFADMLRIEWSCALNNHIFSLTTHHGGLFVSCNAYPCYISNCISSGEMYSAQESGGFIGSCRGGTIENCAATGKLETYAKSGGFSFDATGAEYIKNCYTTVLVGLRSDVREMGGFIGGLWNGTNLLLESCFAAGEVGDFSLDLSKSDGCGSGGFSQGEPTVPIRINNCYYDKQTTAMREWVTGSSKTLSGVTGLLTGTSPKNVTASNPRGYGMASGKDFGLGTANWTYTADHYPQLKVFAGATAANWGSDVTANKVRACSLASTATVLLDTWERGYDWDQYGTRTTSTVSYDRAAADYHAGKTTYDTVREVILPFTATTGDWVELVKGGVNASISDGTTTTTGIKDTIKIIRLTESGRVVCKGSVTNPGMNWFGVSQTAGGQTGSRPLRLISYMRMKAGNDASVEEGSRYDHRQDVELTMIHELKDNMIVGLKPHENMDWSTAHRRGYPTVSDTDGSLSTKYYKAPTDHKNHLLTGFSASRGAVLNTEIWRLDYDSTPTYSVKVTGKGTSSGDPGVAATVDELKWNGLVPFSTSDTESRVYEVSYYWMLRDGRYISDSKRVILNPGTRTLTVNAYDAVDPGLPNSTSLRLGASIDLGPNTSYTLAQASTATTYPRSFGANATAAWSKAQEDISVSGIRIQFLDNNGNEIAGQNIHGTDLKEGTDITLRQVPYYYLTLVNDVVQGKREISASATADVTYTVQKDGGGNYYLRFNKLVNGSAGEPGTADGVVCSDSSAKINDLHYNVVVSLYVEELAHITVKKVVEGYTPAMVGQRFAVDLSGGVSTRFSLTHNQMSLPITVNAGTAKTVNISEIVPMEFSLKDIQVTNNGTGSPPQFNLTHGPDGAVTGGTLTVYPGNDILVTVTNRYGGQGYFKSRTQENNTFAPAP